MRVVASRLILTCLFSVVDIDLISLNEGPEETKGDCEVLVATFQVGELNLQLVNLMLNKDADVKALNRKIAELVREGDMLMVFVDLSLINEPGKFTFSFKFILTVVPNFRHFVLCCN